MKTIKFVGYLFHRYYSKGRRANIAYFSAVCAITALGFMNLMQILALIDQINLIPIKDNDSKFMKRIIIFLTMVPLYFLMTQLFKKSDIVSLKEKYDYNWDKVFSANVWLVIYVILSFSLTIVLALWKKG